VPRRFERRTGRALAVALLAGVLLAGCTDDGPGRPDQLGERRDGPTAGSVPTIPGGVALAPVDPASVLVGADVAYGTPLPSEQVAADALTADPEVVAVVARRAYGVGDGRRLADVVALTLDGAAFFDDAALAAWEQALVGALGGAPPSAVDLAGRQVLRAASEHAVSLAYRDGDLLTVVSGTGTGEPDVTLVVTRQLEARARGEVGSLDPMTPLVAVPVDAAFVPVPSVTFTPIPPLDEGPQGPSPPAIPGAIEVQGRYGVVAGERRTVVWAITVDPGTYPSAEALYPALAPLVTERAGGAPAEATEQLGRVVLVATNPPGTRSARAFRHQGLVLLVEGDRPDQVDAVLTAWMAALGPG
jgi:hypothetical protein